MLTWTEDTVPVAGCGVHFPHGGAGPPLLLLQDLSSSGWLMHHQLLAAEYTVYTPELFGKEVMPVVREW